MGVVERVRNLLNTDLEGMRSHKDPAAVRRYLRDLEWTYRELVQASRHAQATRDYLQGKITRNRECCRRWTDRAELALRHENEPLARIALTLKQTDIVQNTRIAAQLQNCIREQKELAEQLDHLQERILAARYLRPPSAADATSRPSPDASDVERELEDLKKSLNRSRQLREK